MKALLSRVADRIDRASFRERVLIFAALATLAFAVADLVLVDPQVAQQKRLTRELAQRRSEAAAMQEQMARLVASRSASPERNNRERLERARIEIGALERRIAEEQSRFTRPEQMRAVLEEMLSRNRNVALVEIRTLDPAAAGTMSPSATKSSVQPKPAKPVPAGLERTIYRHGVELTVTGGYLDLMAYVEDLERMPSRLYWSGAELDASKYPVVRLRLNVFTLSLDKAWMNV